MLGLSVDIRVKKKSKSLVKPSKIEFMCSRREARYPTDESASMRALMRRRYSLTGRLSREDFQSSDLSCSALVCA